MMMMAACVIEASRFMIAPDAFDGKSLPQFVNQRSIPRRAAAVCS
jgi:hypothetical protein